MVQRVIAGTILIAGMHFAQERQRGGNPQSGAAIFDGKGGCLTCHRVRDKGSRLGPDLTDIGSQRNPAALEKALLDPSPDVSLPYRTYRAVTRDGEIITGIILNQDTVSLQVMDSKERLRSLQKSNLREYGFGATSPMPSYRNKLSAEELTDLIAYLTTLKGTAK
jgi:quinoprotein glucose dehydrogenase